MDKNNSNVSKPKAEEVHEMLQNNNETKKHKSTSRKENNKPKDQ